MSDSASLYWETLQSRKHICGEVKRNETKLNQTKPNSWFCQKLFLLAFIFKEDELSFFFLTYTLAEVVFSLVSREEKLGLAARASSSPDGMEL